MNSDHPGDEATRHRRLPERAGGSVEPSEPAIVDQMADADSHEIAECIRFIEKVRRENPNCLAGLTPNSSAGSRTKDSAPDNSELADSAPADSEGSWLSSEADFPFKIGRFQILRKLGEGGFGLVFLAFDPDLDRQVALKVPRVEALLTDETRRRFLHEGKAAARLNHRNIATVYEAGQIGPLCFIVSAFCAGGSLTLT